MKKYVYPEIEMTKLTCSDIIANSPMLIGGNDGKVQEIGWNQLPDEPTM